MGRDTAGRCFNRKRTDGGAGKLRSSECSPPFVVWFGAESTMTSTRVRTVGVCILWLLLTQFAQISAQLGFISLDCGGTQNFTDDLGIDWMPDESFISGGFYKNLTTSVKSQQYQNVRYFNGSQPKYCYTLPVASGSRYLIRASFLYGNFDNSETYPLFNISIDATTWATIQIDNATEVNFQEIIVSTTSKNSVSVCIIRGSVGVPFISSLELRPLQASMYARSNEDTSYLSYAVRVNYGASNADPVRYPDDPVDRIWESDIAIKGNILTLEQPGTQRISTNTTVTITQASERPPSKVMQTAVYGSSGTLSYRLILDNFPGNAWAKTFLAEIVNLTATNESRVFSFVLRNDTKFAGQQVNLANDQGLYATLETGYETISLPELVNFQFVEANDSNLGPILNAMEILEIVAIVGGTNSQDAALLAELKAKSSNAAWALEAGDPCLPLSWEWINCSSESIPSVTSIVLSSRNLTGVIPSIISQSTSLEDLWLDHNSLNGSIPDLSQLVNLTILHLENNQLSGSFPDFFTDLPNLRELFVQNNNLYGTIPESLLAKSTLNFQYSGNPNLQVESSEGKNWRLIVGVTVAGAVALIAALIGMCVLFRHKKKSKNRADVGKNKPSSENPPPSQAHLLSDPSPLQGMIEPGVADTAHCFSLTDLEEATEKFSKKIGQGGFGSVFYGKMKDGTEIAVKVLAADSRQGMREFLNEVTLLSRIHHRNLVSLNGYCQDNDKRILVYEYMHEGTLRDHLYGPTAKDKPLDWKTRLRMALDAAKGLEYLHTGCSPAIIHRDIKSSNILISSNMKAKVADFGLSKDVMEDATHVSSTVRGTLGYLDPEYYISQQLTEKSDVYSFGVVLLEIISGKEPISTFHFGMESNIVQWARSFLQKGDIQSIIDPALGENFNLDAVWKVAEVAILSVEPFGESRPAMLNVVQCLREALDSEERDETGASDDGLETLSRHSRHSSFLSSPGPSQYYATSEPTSSAFFSDPYVQPSAR